MPNFCAALNCSRNSTHSVLAFFRFPRDPERYITHVSSPILLFVIQTIGFRIYPSFNVIYLPVQTMYCSAELVSLLTDQMRVCHVLNSVYILHEVLLQNRELFIRQPSFTQHFCCSYSLYVSPTGSQF